MYTVQCTIYYIQCTVHRVVKSHANKEGCFQHRHKKGEVFKGKCQLLDKGWILSFTSSKSHNYWFSSLNSRMEIHRALNCSNLQRWTIAKLRAEFLRGGYAGTYDPPKIPSLHKLLVGKCKFEKHIHSISFHKLSLTEFWSTQNQSLLEILASRASQRNKGSSHKKRQL